MCGSLHIDFFFFLSHCKFICERLWLVKNVSNVYFGDYEAKRIGHNLHSRLDALPFG